MENFKQIAEDCLAGKVSGTFVLRCGTRIASKCLRRYKVTKYPYTFTCCTDTYTNCGTVFDDRNSECDIIDFILDMKKEQITIDIPEGKVPVMEQTENGVVVTWKEKELTYTELSDKFKHNPEYIHSSSINSTSRGFFKKVEALRKLTNIRNYFGKPNGTESGFYIYKFDESEFKVATTAYPAIYASDVVAFAKREHAQAAINMLGDELKCLFEPW